MKINIFQNYLHCSLKIRGLCPIFIKESIYQTSTGRECKGGQRDKREIRKNALGIHLTITVEASQRANNRKLAVRSKDLDVFTGKRGGKYISHAQQMGISFVNSYVIFQSLVMVGRVTSMHILRVSETNKPK